MALYETYAGLRRAALTTLMARRFGPVVGPLLSSLQSKYDPVDQEVKHRAQRDFRKAVRSFDVDVKVHGLRDIRRGLRQVSMAADKAVQGELSDVAGTVAKRAQARAPVRSGKLQRSIRKSVTLKRGAAITSNVPYAAIHEWGGQISPRGTPITIKPSRMMSGAVDESDADIDAAVRAIGDAIERAWRY